MKQFVALYDMLTSEEFSEHDTLKEAIQKLEYGSDSGLIMDIAVIDIKANKIMWHQDYLGKEECQERVDNFINKHKLCNIK